MPLYVRRKHLLNRSGVDWTDYNCNHYVGCAHNCQYPCYARELSRKKQWEWTCVAVVENAMELAAREIKRIPPSSKIMVSSMTDPYQPIEKIEKLTRGLIPILGSRDDVQVILITKSDLVQRDLALIKEFPSVSVCMTITSCDNIPKYEPNAPGNVDRIATLQLAHSLGIYTIASIEPWIPGTTRPLNVVRLIYPYVDEVFIGSWNWHFRSGSEPQKKAIATYKAVLPQVVDLLHSHMKKVVVKKELAAKVGEIRCNCTL